MKTSTLILLAAAAAAVYFFVIRQKTAATVAPVTIIQPPGASAPTRGGLDLDSAIASGADLIGDAIGSLFG